MCQSTFHCCGFQCIQHTVYAPIPAGMILEKVLMSDSQSLTWTQLMQSCELCCHVWGFHLTWQHRLHNCFCNNAKCIHTWVLTKVQGCPNWLVLLYLASMEAAIWPFMNWQNLACWELPGCNMTTLYIVACTIVDQQSTALLTVNMFAWPTMPLGVLDAHRQSQPRTALMAVALFDTSLSCYCFHSCTAAALPAYSENQLPALQQAAFKRH